MALFDLCGKMLKEAPVSAKKLSLELESNKKVLLQFEFFAVGMTMGVSEAHRRSLWADR